MRSMLLMALLVPALALAGSNLTPVTAVDVGRSEPTAGPVTPVDGNREPGSSVVLVGTVDTIGGSTYDWMANGCIYRFVVNSPDYGVHAAWMYSADQTTSFPDRNMRYNYYDYAVRDWNWIDPDYMQSGVGAYTDRVGYGNLDADPVTAVALIPAHGGDPLRTDVARDVAPGAGLFEYCVGTPTLEGYLWPPLSIGQNQYVHIHCIDDASRDAVFYSRMMSWCSYSDPVGVAAPQPDPTFPDQNVSASKASDKVCLTWVYSPDGYSQKPGFYRITTDAGENWGDPTEIAYPPAYGPDTLPSFHITSLFPFYDRQDRLHIGAAVGPFVRDTNFILPAEIWHWSPENSPEWTKVHRSVDSLQASIGYNAMMACRPSVGEDNHGNLFIAWEEFDAVNVEPGPPERLRADIWIAGSVDNGVTWETPVKITDGGTVSHRFPSIIDLAIAGDGSPRNDTLVVVYELDEIAGFFVQGEGPATNNPVVAHKVVVSDVITGIAERGPNAVPSGYELAATPNPFGGRTRIRYSLPRAADVRLEVFDASGRPVRTLEQGPRAAGRHAVVWDGREVAAGVYFYTLTTGDASLTEKLIVTR